ncbi:hypothetical protein BGX29_006445 [Mortierella sp. GBA35]|nr:hypothetical protein BGX29_006445 [Mortierella sp. GBA35]
MSRPKPQQGAGVYVQTQSAIQQRVRKRLREEGKVKRSSNCFIKYRTYMHPIIVARFGNQNNKEISRLAGRCWKNEPESVKSIYRQQAAEEKVRHATLYPTYKFTPARPTHKGGDGSRSSSKSKAQSSMSVHPSSPSSIHGSEGSNDDAAVQPAEKSPTEHHSPRQNARADKAATSTADAPSRSKPPVERGFVVTETALYDFTGNAELSEKKHSQSKSRSGSRPNRLNRRLCALQDPLSLEISMASAAPANTLAFIPQSPMTPVASSPAVPSRVSALSQGLAHQRSSAMPTTPVFPLAPTISSTSPHPPTRWNKMVGQPTLRVVIPQQQQQQQWNIPQSSSALMQPSPALMTPANATFQGNINVSGTALVTDQNWAKQLLSPQSVSPFVQQGATNLLQIPQPSTPIPIPVQPVASRKLSGSFGSQIYTSPIPISSSHGMDTAFPWQLGANPNAMSNFGLLYGSQSPSVSMATTLTPVSSAPLVTMHVQHGMVPPSPMHSHPTTVRSQSVSEPTFEKLFTSNGFVALTTPQVSNEMFGDAVWTAKDVPSTPLVTNSWECPALQTPSQDVMDLDQQLLFPVSSTNSSLATSPASSASFLSVTPGNIYPAMTMSTWTTLGDSSRVPSSPVVQSNNNNFNRSPMKNQPLAWSDEEQLRMSISYYEELVQQQKMILSLQRQLREQV